MERTTLLETAISDMTNNDWRVGYAAYGEAAVERYSEQQEYWVGVLREREPESVEMFKDRYPALKLKPLVHEGAYATEVDMVNHPPRYVSDPSGVECITITRHRNFNVGNAIKYLWRAGLKDDPTLAGKGKQIEDLRKAVWYITDEIERLEQA